MSIKKVANIAGVSIATVSRYFNNPDKVSKKTQEKVQSAADKIDYSPNSLAQNLRRGKTGLIIAVVPTLSSSVFEPIIRQLNQLAKDQDYTLLLKEAECNSLTVDYFKYLLRCKQADGFIVLSGINTANNSSIKHSKMPVVLAHEPDLSKQSGLPCLSIDYFSAAQEATQYLIDHHHKHIAFVSQYSQANSVKELERGFQSTIQTNQGDISVYSLNKNEQTLSIKEKVNQLLNNSPKPTAVLCADDGTAIEVIHWLKQKGLRVPDDISVMGFHNTHYSALSDPPLTTVNNPLVNIGHHTIEILFQLINNESVEEPIQPFKHSIVERGSIKQLD